MVEEGAEEDEECDDGVVHAEEGEVGFEAEEGGVVGGGEGEGGEGEEEVPWTAVGCERGVDLVGGAGDEFEVGGGVG